MKKIFYTLPVLLLAQLAQAQRDSSKHNQLDEVVVTATKAPVKLGETGKIVTVITKEQIEHSAGKDLPQILSEQTGLIVNGANSNPSKDKSVYLLGAKNDYTLLLIDGVPLLDGSGLTVGAYDLRMIPVDQIDHIEILQGSQSTLYGSNAVAGVINIITKKGGAKKIGFSGSSSYGSYHTYNGNANLHGSTKLVDYNLNYNYTSTKGISEATDTTGKANYDKDGFQRQSFQANLSFNAGSKLKISPFYRYTYYKGDFDADAFTDAPYHYNILLNNTGMVATYQLPKGSITANYGYTFSRRDYLTNYPSTFRGQFHSADVYLQQSLNSQVKLIAGVNYQDYHLLDSSLPKKNPQSTITSPYLSFLINSNNGLSVEVGGRYNYSKNFGSYFTYSFNAAYKVADYLKFFANVSTGFRAPVLSELFGRYGANPDLKPEKSTSIQGGVQTELFDNSLFITATAFNREVKDVITYLGNGYLNLDFQHDKGGQLEVKWTPVKTLQVKAAYAYVTGNIMQTRNGKDSSYFNLLRQPKNVVNLNIGYQVTPQLDVSGSLQTQDRRNDIYFDPVSYKSSTVFLKSYALVNMYAEYRLLKNKLRVFADAKNITGSKYAEVYGYNTMGFNFTGGLYLNL